MNIEPGTTYLVDFGGIRFKVEVIRESPIVSGWWWCTSSDGKEAMFPTEAFTEEANTDAN